MNALNPLPGRVSGGARRVSWSPSVTLVPTRHCFNACGYCSFRRPSVRFGPGGLPADSLDDAIASSQIAARPGALEVLLLSGEVHPQAPGRRAWFQRLEAISRLALAAGRLPHTNAGPLSRVEMARLGRLNPSMGLMFEGVGPSHDRLHGAAPSKRLDVRLGQLDQAGRLGIPFTTGLLLGVGEAAADRREALGQIARLQRIWGHIQEVILQPFRPDGAAATPLTPEEQSDLLGTIADARAILPPEVHLQLPPNLWPLESLPTALEAGIDDLGGLDVADVINPSYPQPSPAQLARVLAEAGWELVPRLCVHGAWIPGLPLPLRRRVQALAQTLERGC